MTLKIRDKAFKNFDSPVAQIRPVALQDYLEIFFFIAFHFN